jgi:hypothetical protein
VANTFIRPWAKLQSGFRGHQDRKKVRAMKDGTPAEAAVEA